MVAFIKFVLFGTAIFTRLAAISSTGM